jgi:hypothetical protein
MVIARRCSGFDDSEGLLAEQPKEYRRNGASSSMTRARGSWRTFGRPCLPRTESGASVRSALAAPAGRVSIHARLSERVRYEM